MALLNKLFSTRKKTYKQQDNVCERLFTFSKNQVRVVLFRECDFRGRKLLFDSQTVQKVPLTQSNGAPEEDVEQKTPGQKEKFSEVSGGYGYACSKPNSDFSRLGEMIFGSVAMSYRGTSYKIHSLKTPQRLMYTQVFSSPRGLHRPVRRMSNNRRSNPRTNTSNQSLEQSIRFDDSGASSANSMAEQLSFNSSGSGSDTLLVCRGGVPSMPVDVPVLKPPTTCLSGDSGFSGEQTCSSLTSGPPSFSLEDMPPLIGGGVTLSSGSLYKKLLKNTSSSLDRANSQINSSASADECFVRSQPKGSKLGLAVVVSLTETQEDNMSRFLMEHAAVLESVVWRARQGVELAYLRPSTFYSLMHEMSETVSRCLLDLFAGPQLSASLWLSLSSGCDKVSSINVSGDSILSAPVPEKLESNNNCVKGETSDECDSSEFTFFSLMRLLKNENCLSERRDFGNGKNFAGVKFVRELCELLETVDAKDTNFFISTLVTAVLTHHLGWVSTVLPPSQLNEELLAKLNRPCNALWSQLMDLYGAVGHPTKMAHTLITGTNKSELISKILNSLTYFIRCCKIEHKNVTRTEVAKENAVVDAICNEYACIPKENYKKYEDHLREMAFIDGCNGKCEVRKKFDVKKQVEKECDEKTENREVSKKTGLVRTPSCLSQLTKPMNCSDELKNHLYPQLETLCMEELKGARKNKCEASVSMEPDHFVAEAPMNKFELSNREIHEKVNKLLRVPPSAVPLHLGANCTKECLRKYDEHIITDSSTKKVIMEKQTRCDDSEDKKGVMFVLGDDDKLVGLRKEHSCIEFSDSKSSQPCGTKLGMKKEKSCFDFKNYQENGEDECLRMKNLKTVAHSSNTSTLQQKPDISNVRFEPQESEDDRSFENSEFKDEYFERYKGRAEIKPSTSWTYLKAAGLEREPSKSTETTKKVEKEFTRSQSVPPEERKPESSTNETKSRYRYSGVKFNFQQYPQIVENYMKSKNIELSNLPFDKKIDCHQIMSLDDSTFDFTSDGDNEEMEALQTPSNASELECISDLTTEKQNVPKMLTRTKAPVIDDGCGLCRQNLQEDNENEAGMEVCCKKEKAVVQKMKIISLPMPKSVPSLLSMSPIGYTTSLMRGVADHYMSDMVLQGTSAPKTQWESLLRNDLVLEAKHPLLEQPVEEAVAIIANTDTWDVQLMSSHTYVVDKGSSGIRVGMSQLVANMLESLLHMWKLRAPAEYCLMHIEQRLQEFCIRSQALSNLLLDTEFCSMDFLTSTLQLEVNDVPLLMAVASTHSPQVTEKYGLSFH